VSQASDPFTAPARASRTRGITFAGISALGFGSSIVLSRELAVRGFGAPTTFGMRFALAGVLTLGLAAVLRRPLAPARGERLAVVLLGLVGYFGESTLFFGGLSNGSAAMVTLLFYVYPAIVLLLEAALARRVPPPRTIGAVAITLAGSAMIVLTGGDLSISPIGALFSVAAAAAFSIYLVVSHRVVRRSDPIASAAWLALACSAGHLLRGVATSTLQNPGASWGLLILNGAVTVVAFAGMFAALQHLSASEASVVFTCEALTAILLGWVFLGEVLAPVQLVGGALVIGGAIVIATAAEPEVAEELEEGSARAP